MFDREQFEKDLIAGVLAVKDQLEKKHKVKCILDVSWSLPDLGFGKKELKAG